MKLVENPMIPCDLMSYISLTQAAAAMYDRTLDAVEQNYIQKGMMLVGSIFCGGAIAVKDTKLNIDGVDCQYWLTPTICTIGEEGSRDGVYAYASINPDTSAGLPEPDSRIDNTVCIYGSFDIKNPFVEFYFGDLLMCKVDIVTNDMQVIPHQVMCDKDKLTNEQMEQTYEAINKGVLDSIAQMNMVYMKGYKEGLDMAKGEIES